MMTKTAARPRARKQAKATALKPPLASLAQRNARLIALLDSFEQRDPTEQQRELTDLAAAIDADRPGQRSVFGEGLNL